MNTDALLRVAIAKAGGEIRVTGQDVLDVARADVTAENRPDGTICFRLVSPLIEGDFRVLTP